MSRRATSLGVDIDLVHARRGRPRVLGPGQPPPSIVAVSDFLAHGKGSIREIAEATGYSPSSVETALTFLRRQGSPLVANQTRQKPGPEPFPPKPPKVELPREASVETIRQSRVAAGAANPSVVQRALQARSALEQAWGGER